MLTEEGETMVKLGCAGMELSPMQVSVYIIILLYSCVLMEPIVVADKPACNRLLVNRQQEVEPIYENSLLLHTLMIPYLCPALYMMLYIVICKNGKEKSI